MRALGGFAPIRSMRPRLVVVAVALLALLLGWLAVRQVQLRYTFGDWFPSDPPARIVACGGLHYYPASAREPYWDRAPEALPVIGRSPAGRPIRADARCGSATAPMEVYEEVAPNHLVGYVRSGGP